MSGGGPAEPHFAASQLSRRAAIPFFVIAVLLAARPLLSELHERVDLTVMEAMGVTGGTTPALAAVLDSLQLAASAALLAAGPICRRRGFRFAILGVALLVGAIGVAAGVAGNPRVALNMGGTLAAFAVTGLALTCRPYPRVWTGCLLALVLASGTTFALRGWLQHFVDFPDLLEEFQTRAAQLPAETREQPEFINLERRLRSAEIYSFQAHPNIAGSCLMMWGLLAVAGGTVGARRWTNASPAEKRATFGFLAMAVLCAGALHWTGSAGAMGAFAVGLGVLVVATMMRTRTASPGRATVVVVALYIAAVAALFGYGIANGTLPGASLAFRWYYWTAGWSAYFDAPLTGVGVGNFSAAYLLHKPAVSTEEVRNAHDLWVSLLVELGPLGLVAGLLLLVAVFRNAVRSLLTRWEATGVDGARPPARPKIDWPALRGIVAAGLGVVLLQGWGSDSHFDNPAWAVLWLVEFVVVYIIAIALFFPALAAGDRPSVGATSAIWNGLAWGAGAAAIAVFVHNVVCFSLFTPAGLSLLVACVAATRAHRFAPASALVIPSGPNRWLACGAVALAIAHVAIVSVPTVRAQAAFNDFERAGARQASAESLITIARRSTQADSLDPALPRQFARRLAGSVAHRAAQAETLQSAAIEFAKLSLARDPGSTAAHEILAELLTNEASASGTRQTDALAAAVDHRLAVIALYPTDPRARLKLAEAAARLLHASGDGRWADVAATQADEAVRLDRLRPEGDVVRLRDAEIARIAEVRRAIGRSAASSSAPASSRR